MNLRAVLRTGFRLKLGARPSPPNLKNYYFPRVKQCFFKCRLFASSAPPGSQINRFWSSKGSQRDTQTEPKTLRKTSSILAPKLYPKLLQKGPQNEPKIAPKPTLGSTSAADLQQGNYRVRSSTIPGSPGVLPGPLPDSFLMIFY